MSSRRRRSVLELLLGGAFGGGAHDHAVLRRLDALQHRLQALARVVAEPAADALQVLVRREHDVAAREAQVRGQPRALAAHRVLRDLDHDRLAGLEQLLDPRRRALDVLGAVVDLAGVQDAVAAAADVDERGLHAREHVLHAPEVDVADHRGGAGAGHVVLDEHVFLEDRDLVALAVLGDHHQLVGDPRRRQRSARDGAGRRDRCGCAWCGCRAWGRPRRPAPRSSLASTASAASWSRRPPWPPLLAGCGVGAGRCRVASTSGVASSRWVAAVSPARPSVSSASTVVGFFPPRPRPPRRRRRFFGPVGELSPSAAPACSDRSSRSRRRRSRSRWRRPSVAAGAAAGAAVAVASARPRRRTSRPAPLRLRSVGRARGARSAAATAATTAPAAPGSAGARLACLAVARGWLRLVRRRRLRLRCGDTGRPLGPRGRLRCGRALRRSAQVRLRLGVRARGAGRAARRGAVAASRGRLGLDLRLHLDLAPGRRLASASPRVGARRRVAVRAAAGVVS